MSEKLIKSIETYKISNNKLDLSVMESKELIKEYGNSLDLVYAAFKLGYMRGNRAAILASNRKALAVRRKS